MCPKRKETWRCGREKDEREREETKSVRLLTVVSTAIRNFYYSTILWKKIAGTCRWKEQLSMEIRTLDLDSSLADKHLSTIAGQLLTGTCEQLLFTTNCRGDSALALTEIIEGNL